MCHINGAKSGSAPDQFRVETTMVGVCSTFAFATKTTVEEQKNCSKNGNTAKSTGFWLSVWKNWCVAKTIRDEIENQLASLNSIQKKAIKWAKTANIEESQRKKESNRERSKQIRK